MYEGAPRDWFFTSEIPSCWIDRNDELTSFAWELFERQFDAWTRAVKQGRFQVFMAERQRLTGRSV